MKFLPCEVDYRCFLFLQTASCPNKYWMRYFELFEAPIGNLELVGDWSKPGSFDDRGDTTRELLQTPKAIQKIRNMWARVPQTFHFYIMNMAKISADHAGVIDYATLMQRTSEPYSTLKKVVKNDPGAITVVYTHNVTGRMIPLTGWMLAHRFIHALQFRSAANFDQLETNIYNLFVDLAKVYGRNAGYKKVGSYTFLADPPMMSALMNALFTMRSARKQWLNNPLDLVPELMAQYLMTGKITINPLPEHIGQYFADPAAKAIQDKRLQKIASTILPEEFDALLEHLKGKIVIF